MKEEVAAHVSGRANWAAAWMFARPDTIFMFGRAAFGFRAMFAR
jgi:hypothetical protein